MVKKNHLPSKPYSIVSIGKKNNSINLIIQTIIIHYTKTNSNSWKILINPNQNAGNS